MKKNLDTSFWKGQLFELVDTDKKSFFTQLIQSDPDLLVQRPATKENNPMIIKNPMHVTVYFHDDMHHLCTFKTTIDQLENQKVRINRPEKGTIKKAQRRRFFRVKIAMEIQIDLPHPEHPEQMDSHSATTFDISGGGVAFISQEEIVKKDDQITGTMFLNTKAEKQKVPFQAQVVRVLQQENKLYRISLKFIGMNETLRTDIIRFCMAKQIEQRKKYR